MSHSTKQSIAVLAILLCFSACAIPPQNETANTTSFAQPNCPHLECWDGIVPGVTTFEEAQQLLVEKYGERNVTVDDRYNSISWRSNNKDDKFLGGWVMRINEQRLISGMLLSFDQLTIAELIDQIGEPSLVFVTVSRSPGYPCAGVIVHYPNRGVNAWLNTKYETNSIGIILTQEISTLELMPLEVAENFKISSHWGVEWQGYTDYCKLAYPEAFETVE